MINVMMTDDIRKYETKSFGPFTTRQVVCIGLALLYSVPIGVATPFALDTKIMLIVILAMPMVMAGYLKLDGMKFEVLLIRMLYVMVLTPRHRKYKAVNTFREAQNRLDAAIERRKLSRMTDSQRKKYEKAKQKPVVRYSRKPALKVYT